MWLRKFTSLAAVFLATSPVLADGWANVTTADGSIPAARHEAAFATVGSYLLLVGGRGIKPVDIFDPNYNQWIEGTEPPLEVHHFQGVDIDGTLWAVGAFTGGYPDETPLPYALVYDPEGDDWRQGPTIPTDRRRGSAGAAVHDGYIYIAGGAINGHRGGHVPWLDRLDPATGEWVRLADAPHARDHAALVELDDKLVFVGGRLSMAPENTFGAVVPEVDIYDIATDTWKTLSSPLPNPRAGIAAAVLDGSVFVIGGESGSTDEAYGKVDRLDIQMETWSAAPSLLRARHGTGAAVFDDRIWIAAGSGARGGGPELHSMEQFVD